VRGPKYRHGVGVNDSNLGDGGPWSRAAEAWTAGEEAGWRERRCAGCGCRHDRVNVGGRHCRRSRHCRPWQEERERVGLPRRWVGRFVRRPKGRWPAVGAGTMEPGHGVGAPSARARTHRGRSQRRRRCEPREPIGVSAVGPHCEGRPQPAHRSAW
jgi:hypothetical protein